MEVAFASYGVWTVWFHRMEIHEYDCPLLILSNVIKSSEIVRSVSVVHPETATAAWDVQLKRAMRTYALFFLCVNGMASQ